jgi:hypothetical protein
MKSLSFREPQTPVSRRMIITGKLFDITLTPQRDGDWHWLITAPGEVVLSGSAPSEMQALDSACRAGRALARLVAA